MTWTLIILCFVIAIAQWGVAIYRNIDKVFALIGTFTFMVAAYATIAMIK